MSEDGQGPREDRPGARKIRVREERCSGCGYCALFCPEDAIRLDGYARLDGEGEKCTGCGHCVDACPNLAIEGWKPPRRTPGPERSDTIVVGAGIGGLMAAASLARSGERVAVFEQLPFAGGRYTEIDHRGYRVTTGAWSNPGPESKIGRFVEGVGGRVEYLRPGPADLPARLPFPVKVFAPGGVEIRSREGVLDQDEFGTFFEMAAGCSTGAGERQSTRAFLESRFRHPALAEIVNSAVAVATGLSVDELPSAEFLRIVREAARVALSYGFPRGGTRSLIEALEAALGAAGGTLHLRARVARILVEGGGACGVELESGERVEAKRVIANTGVRRLAALVGEGILPAEYRARIQALVPVRCGALILGASRPLFPRIPIACTIRTRRVVGVFEPTLFDPSVAPPGRTLYDVFFLVRGADNRAELREVMTDLEDLFPGFRDGVEMMVPMFFTGAWPGTETAQTFGQTAGERFDPATPIPGLYLAGMDCVGSGIAGDLIPDGVERLIEAVGSWARS